MKKVKLSIGATINLGNYENIKPEMETVIEVEDHNTVEEAIEVFQKVCKDVVKNATKGKPNSLISWSLMVNENAKIEDDEETAFLQDIP